MPNPNQPRQPKDMQGLLKFCIEATKGEDAPDISDPEKVLNDMDPEKRKWLEEALSSMSVDIVQQLANGIKILNSDTSEDDKEEVLDQLEDWLGNIDMAVNFHKIGGFSCLRNCIEGSSPSLRSGACHLVAEISQNNPYCQEKLLSEGFLELLIHQLDSDSDGQCQVKAMYAISCMSREYVPALDMFTKLDGWSVIMRALQRDNNVKLVTKCCYFLSSALVTSASVGDTLVDMGMVTQLAGVLSSDIGPHHEHIVSALRCLMTKCPGARDQARCHPGLETLLLQRRQELAGHEEYQETVEHCEGLLQLLAPEFVPSEEWQVVEEWQSVPPGCHVTMDINTGKKMARKDPVTDR